MPRLLILVLRQLKIAMASQYLQLMLKAVSFYIGKVLVIMAT
jgi:hypothetical protein